MDKRKVMTGHYQENMFGDLMDREDYFHKLPNLSRRQVELPKEKEKVFFIKEDEIDWGLRSQELLDEEKNTIYKVYDLTECPEDATIYRDLFNANDYIAALKLGMKLAKEGYTSIKVMDIDKLNEYLESKNKEKAVENTKETTKEIADKEIEDLFILD